MSGAYKQMRILLIFHSSAMKGGANISGLNLLRGLRSLGHDVHVLVPTDGELCRRLDEEGIGYKTVFYRQAWPYTIGSFQSIVKFIPRTLKEWNVNRHALQEILSWVRDEVKPDLIHSNSSVMTIGFEVARRLGLPHVSHFREYGFKDTGFPMWHVDRMKRYPKQYNIAVSQDIFNFHSLPKEKSAVIYNGIYSREDYPESPESSVGEKDDYLLYVGGLYASKGLDDIFEAYSCMDPALRQKYPLWLAGSSNTPRYEEHLHRKADSLGIANDITWLGERDDVADLMRGARGLLVASHSEAFGRIMAEAAFNYCPLIARDRRGLHEQFEQGRKVSGREIGLRFDSTDELHRRIEELLKADAGEYSEMLDAAYHTAGTLYTNEANAEKVAGFYKSTVMKP